MMALAQRMRVFGVVHHDRLQIKFRKWCTSSARENHDLPLLRMLHPDLNAAQRKGGLMFRVVQPIGRPTVVMVELLLIVTSDRR